MNMFKNFLMKKMLKNQLKKAGLPEAEQERLKLPTSLYNELPSPGRGNSRIDHV